ncbi:MAG: septal ring lytic transglycosylase RlpA family protein [Alphaproteobacteria bacterium]|nr:septal ring lytic transglycosylase RlpA family protein [Alphaproteobacteria bacterium]
MQWCGAVSLGILAVFVALAGCVQPQVAARVPPVPTAALPAPGQDGPYKVGNPYLINGVKYEPKEDPNYSSTGIASWYGYPFHGQRTANGEVYDMNALTAAHQTLPMPTYVRVTNLENGRSVILKVNDRGPFVQGRIIDLSHRAAQLLGYAEKGTAMVRVEAVNSSSENMIATRGVVKDAPMVPIAAAPTPVVAIEALPPVQGVALAPQLAANTTRFSIGALPPEITVVGVPSVNRIYVQAGAFSSYDSANNVRLALGSVGPVVVSTVDIGGRQLYRVRVGPIESVARAETTLSMVVARGHTEARIIVD